MTTTPPTIDTPLREYFVSIFQPQRLAGHEQKYVREQKRAIAWLEMALSRPAVVADLDSANLRRMGRMMFGTGCAFHWVKKMTRCLASIWRHAHQSGLLPHYESVTIREPQDKRPSFLTRPPKVGTLRRFYLETYRPGVKRKLRQEVDPAVKHLDMMARGFVMLEDVTDELLQQFTAWLAERGRSAQRIGRYVACIKQIVRSWDPARFPKPKPQRSKLPAPEPGTLRHFFETVHLPQRMLDVCPTHVAHARRSLVRLHDHYMRDILVSELTDALAADHLNWLRTVRGLRASSTNNAHRSILFTMWRHAYDLGLVPQLPRVKKLREQQHEPDSWDTAELSRLLAATSCMRDRHKWRGCVPADKWWRALILVAWWTGLRASSLLRIQSADVDLDSRWLYAAPGAMKTRNGKRFRLGQDAIDAVRDISQPPRKLLFEFPYRREALWRQFRSIQAAAGLPHNGRPVSRLHKLRRSVCTQAAVHGGLPAAVALLGHSTPTVTITRYLDPSKMPGADATEFLPKLNNGDGKAVQP